MLSLSTYFAIFLYLVFFFVSTDTVPRVFISYTCKYLYPLSREKYTPTSTNTQACTTALQSSYIAGVVVLQRYNILAAIYVNVFALRFSYSTNWPFRPRPPPTYLPPKSTKAQHPLSSIPHTMYTRSRCLINILPRIRR